MSSNVTTAHDMLPHILTKKKKKGKLSKMSQNFNLLVPPIHPKKVIILTIILTLVVSNGNEQLEPMGTIGLGPLQSDVQEN